MRWSRSSVPGESRGRDSKFQEENWGGAGFRVCLNTKVDFSSAITKDSPRHNGGR